MVLRATCLTGSAFTSIPIPGAAHTEPTKLGLALQAAIADGVNLQARLDRVTA
jgi:hypothetical protein